MSCITSCCPSSFIYIILSVCCLSTHKTSDPSVQMLLWGFKTLRISSAAARVTSTQITVWLWDVRANDKYSREIFVLINQPTVIEIVYLWNVSLNGPHFYMRQSGQVKDNVRCVRTLGFILSGDHSRGFTVKFGLSSLSTLNVTANLRLGSCDGG